MDPPKPIGYWLKHLHNLLETHLEQVLADLGVDRREWQLLNTLSRGGRTPEELVTALAPFWGEGEPAPGEALARLADRGWIAGADRPEALAAGAVTLTERGRAAHAELAGRIDDTRAVVVAGLTSEQYAQTVRVLSVMAANVEAAIAANPRGSDPRVSRSSKAVASLG